MPEVTVIGDVNIDLLTSPIDSFPRKDLQKLVPWINLQIGGGASNFAFTISKLGLKTRLIGLVGKDIFGEFLFKKIKEFGIENKLRRTNKKRTGITLGVQFKDGSRSLLTFRGTNTLLSLKHFKLEEIEGKALHIGGFNFLDSLRKDVLKILKYGKKKGMLTTLEPDIKSKINFKLKELKKIAKFVDIFFPNKFEGKMLTKEKNERKIVKKLLDFGFKIVALKLGERGCLIGENKKLIRIKGIKIKPINPTGAGDIFNASFVFYYLKTKDIEKAGKFANACASLAISRKDDRFPSEKEVLKFLEKKYGR